MLWGILKLKLFPLDYSLKPKLFKFCLSTIAIHFSKINFLPNQLTHKVFSNLQNITESEQLHAVSRYPLFYTSRFMLHVVLGALVHPWLYLWLYPHSETLQEEIIILILLCFPSFSLLASPTMPV